MRKSPRKMRVLKPCAFCEKKITPDYKDVNILTKYISERGKIMGRAKTGICGKHQRELTHAIKNARQIAFLPFIVRI